MVTRLAVGAGPQERSRARGLHADRIATLQPKLLLLRGLRDPDKTAKTFELEIHQAVPGSQYIELPEAGHFPLTECPEDANALIEKLLASL